MGIVSFRQPVLPDDDRGVDAGLVQAAEHLHQAPERPAPTPWPPVDRRHDHLTRLRPEAPSGRNPQIHDHPLVERHDEPHPRVINLVPADDIGVRAFEHLDDPSLGAVAGPLHPHRHPIAVHRLIQIDTRHIDVVAAGFRGDESEAAGVDGEAADHQMHPIREAVAISADPDQITGVDEPCNLPAKPVAVGAGNLQGTHQLPDRRGVMHPGADAAGDRRGISVRPVRRIRHRASTTCKSPTLVPVGPVRTRSPSRSKYA